MAGYVMGFIDITDPEGYKAYAAAVPAIVAAYDGEYLVRGGPLTAMEGESPAPRIAVIRFPSVERAHEWYNSEEYRPVRQLRIDNSQGNLIIVEGV